MKKIFLFAAVAATTLLASCDMGTPKANLRSDIDTLSYEIGLAYTGQAQNALMQFEIDSANVDEFIKGAVAGLSAEEDAKKRAYFMGIIFGMQSEMQLLQGMEREIFGTDSTLSLSRKNFIAAVAAGLKDKSEFKVNDSLVTPDYAYQLANERIMVLREKVLEQQYAKEKEAGAKFLEENAKNDSVKTLPCGVQYKVLKEGKGAIPTETSTVVVNYEGKLINDIVFDSSNRNGKNEPAEFRVDRVIKGWTEALKVMPVGSEWEIYIPYELGYGVQGTRNIPPFATLVFKVELLDVK